MEGASELDEDAAALLEEMNGDVDKARRSYMGYTLAYLEEAMPELYRTIKTNPDHPDTRLARRSSALSVCPVQRSSTA